MYCWSCEAECPEGAQPQPRWVLLAIWASLSATPALLLLLGLALSLALGSGWREFLRQRWVAGPPELAGCEGQSASWPSARTDSSSYPRPGHGIPQANSHEEGDSVPFQLLDQLARCMKLHQGIRAEIVLSS